MTTPPVASRLPLELQSASALLRLLRERKLGSLELLDLLLARIERLNPRLNAVVARDVEGARRQARAADDLPAERRGPLHGLPMTIKDVYEVVGMPATCGMPELARHLPAQDADAVARLRAAGAIPFGKTNVPFAAARCRRADCTQRTRSRTGARPAGGAGRAGPRRLVDPRPARSPRAARQLSRGPVG